MELRRKVDEQRSGHVRSTGSEPVPTGYSESALEKWAERFHTWAAGGEPKDLAHVHPDPAHPTKARDCFAYFISGAKIRAPAAARTLIALLASSSSKRPAGKAQTRR